MEKIDFEDNELVYLFHYETSLIAKNILYEKYKNRLLSASIRYIQKWIKFLPIEISELLSINYQNFMLTIQTYDVNNRKFNFASCLFTINRSELRKLIIYYINNNSQKTMTHCISLNDDVKNSNEYKKAIVTNESVTSIENKVAFDNVQWLIKYVLSGQDFIARVIYTLFINGFTPKQIAKIFKMEQYKIYFIIKKINQSIRNCNKKYW